MTFRKAQRRQVKLKIAITGPSGSGKTFSGLLIASGIGKKIAVVDTENKSASLYADMEKGPLAGLNFDLLEIEPPYTIGKYLEAIEAAEKGGYDVLFIDSISHAWAGEGGLLDKKTALDARAASNPYANWAPITKEHEAFRARLLQSDIHLICSMRSKQDYILEVNEKGKQAPKKVGLAPIQRDGMEYEFTVVLDLGMDHSAVASKDRTSLFDGEVFKPTKKTGEKILAWLKKGKPVEKPAEGSDPNLQEHLGRVGPDVHPVGEFPEPEGPRPDEFNSVQISEEETAKVNAAIEVLRKLKLKDELIWQGITSYLRQVHGREIVDVAAMTNLEAATAIIYLGRWAEHIRAKNGKKAAQAGA